MSVKLAHFVTAGAIDLLFCEEVPLGQVPLQNQKSAPYDFFLACLGGIENCPNLDIFAIILQIRF
jgi:hypothetical protein